jgi:hypothetical protein
VKRIDIQQDKTEEKDSERFEVEMTIKYESMKFELGGNTC